VSVAPTAKAGDGQIAAGVAGGLIGGALLGGAIAASRPAPVYVAPARSMSKSPLPPGSRALLGRIWLAYAPRSGLRLI